LTGTLKTAPVAAGISPLSAVPPAALPGRRAFLPRGARSVAILPPAPGISPGLQPKNPPAKNRPSLPPGPFPCGCISSRFFSCFVFLG
jgi:hypothetical protein